MDKFVKNEHRAVMKFLLKEGSSSIEIHRRMVTVYGTEVPSYATVTRWVKEFKHGRESLEDDPRSGRPLDATDDATAERVETLIMKDRRIKVAEICTEVGISHGSVLNIIHEKLGMSKVSTRWVPRNLSVHDKHQRATCSQELLELHDNNPAHFLARLITGDETWIHHWNPDSKLESMQWKHKASPPPKEVPDPTFCWKNHGNNFLECKSCNSN